MNSTLYIRHLSCKLSTEERQDLLKHFGAQKVWFINKNSNTAFAQFVSIPAAKQALYKLHQLEILGKRLTVEYANDEQQKSSKTFDGNIPECNKVKEFVDSLNSWNSSLDFHQQPSTHLLYKYPPPTPSILFNILDALLKNKPFYTQTLHLMNKMCLDPPFSEIKDDVKTYIKESFHDLGIEISRKEESIPLPVQKSLEVPSSEESEISSDDNFPTIDNAIIHLPVKRKSKIKMKNIPNLSLQNQMKSSTNGKKCKLKTGDVFEDVPLHETKKIELKFNSTKLPSGTTEIEENVGTIGKMQPNKTNESVNNEKETSKFVSAKELQENKLSIEDMKILPVFKNYNPGKLSTKLYIKNLSKDVKVADLERIYKKFIEDCDFSDKQLFDLRLMQEGRMKGQAFINFPNVEICQKALNETNGFLLKDKPMVVQFGKAPSK